MLEAVNWLTKSSFGGKYSLIYLFIMMVLVVVAALQLVKFSSVIISRTKFGGIFIGGAIIAAITSIPELLTEVSQALNKNPGAGTADDIGSNAFSVFLIGVASLIFIKSMFLKKMSKWTKISIFVSFLLALVMTLFMVFNKDVTIGTPGKFAIGIIPLSLFLFYVFYLFIQYKFGDKEEEEAPLSKKLKKISLKKSIAFFLVWAVVLAGLSICLNISAGAVQNAFNASPSSIGGILLSIVTSFPEVIVFFGFLKVKKYNAGIAALIGSHVFNLGISFFGDLAYSGGAIFNHADVGKNWPIALITSIMLLFLLIHLSISKYLKKKVTYLIFPTLIMITYIVGWIYIFLYK